MPIGLRLGLGTVLLSGLGLGAVYFRLGLNIRITV